MHVEHGRLRVGVDEATGSIAYVADSTSGRFYLDARADPARLGRLFRVIAPIRGWSSHAAASWDSGPPRIERVGDTVVLRYHDLSAPAGPLGVSAEVELRPRGPSELVVTLRLASRREEGDLTDVLFPWLGAWTAPATWAVALGGARSITAGHFPVNRGITFSRWHQREYYTYPIDLYAPWLDVSSPGGGIGLISYQGEARNLGAFLENLAGYRSGVELSAGFNHHLQLRAGQSWQSPPIGISLHDGDWHATADRYSAWVDEWFRPPPTPVWARAAIGFQNVLFRGFDGTPIRPLESLPDVAAAGVAAGVPHLCLWDYVLLGEYSKLDDVVLHGFSDADRAALQGGLARARRAGARLSSLQNFRLVKPTSALFRDGSKAEVCRRYDGSPFVEEYAGSLTHAMVITNHVGPMVHPVDARLTSVRRRVLRLIEASLDLGFDSHFYDQPFENWPSYHPDRGDDGPDGAHAGTVSLLGEVRRALARRSPEGILVGEYCDVFGSEAIDLWMSWYTDFEDLRRSVYSIPQTLQSWVVDQDLSAAVRAFTVGAQLCLTTAGGESHLGEQPEFAAGVARLSALRARAARVWQGRFRDGYGFELEADGPVAAGGFQGPDGGAIVLGSPGEGGRARMTVDHNLWLDKPDSGRLLRLDGRTQEVDRDEIDVELDADEVAVWYL